MVRSLRRCPPPSLSTEGDPLHTWPCLGCGSPEGILIKRVRLLRGRFDLSPPLVLDKFEFFFSNLVKFDTLRCRHRQHLSQGTASYTGALVYFENYRGTGYKLGNVKEICKIIIFSQFLWRSSPAILTSFDIALPCIEQSTRNRFVR